MKEIIIIGNGPAGASAALYTARAGIATTIIGKDFGALTKAEKIENYYGFEQPIAGAELVQRGINGAKRLGASVVVDEVLGVGYADRLFVKTKTETFKADAIILATGSSRATPRIKGFAEYDGKGISYCAVCDAFFHKNKAVAVYGAGEYAISEANELLPIVKTVTLLTDKAHPLQNTPKELIVNTAEVAEFFGSDGVLQGVRFTNGERIEVSGVFIAVGVAGSNELAKKIGAETNGNKIVVDEHMATNIPGLFAAGDCTGGLLQISKAVSDGAKAGTSAIKYIRNFCKE